MREFESTALGRRMRWPKRMRITWREKAGDIGPSGVSLASRLVGLWTSFVAEASLGQWERKNLAGIEQGRKNAE
jgi:hypothetical protein